MATATRTTKTFSLETEVLKEIERTKGDASASERVNNLLKTGLEVERVRRLENEASAFFSDDAEDRSSRKAFQSASVKAAFRD
jgi:predicted secreted protein